MVCQNILEEHNDRNTPDNVITYQGTSVWREGRISVSLKAHMAVCCPCSVAWQPCLLAILDHGSCLWQPSWSHFGNDHGLVAAILVALGFKAIFDTGSHFGVTKGHHVAMEHTCHLHRAE